MMKSMSATCSIGNEVSVRVWAVCEAADRDTDDEDGCGCPGLQDGRPSPASQTERARALERRCGLRLFDALLIGLEHPLEPCARCRGVHQTCGKVAEARPQLV